MVYFEVIIWLPWVKKCSVRKISKILKSISYHQLLIHIILDSDVKCHFLVGDSQSRHLIRPLGLAGFVGGETEVLEVVYSLRGHEVELLESIPHRAPVHVTEAALKRHVVVLGAAADETLLQNVRKHAINT